MTGTEINTISGILTASVFVLPILITLIVVFVASKIFSIKNKDTRITMYDIDNQIRNLPGKKAVLKNIRTECEGHYGTIDTLLIHEQGIFLIYYTRTNGKKIDNHDKNKWIVSTKNGKEYIPNYITQSDYDIIFLTKILNLYKHNFKTIISLGEKEIFKNSIKQVNSIRITSKLSIIHLLKKLIDENIVIYEDNKVEKMQQLVEEASERVQKNIYNMGKV